MNEEEKNKIVEKERKFIDTSLMIFGILFALFVILQFAGKFAGANAVFVFWIAFISVLLIMLSILKVQSNKGQILFDAKKIAWKEQEEKNKKDKDFLEKHGMTQGEWDARSHEAYDKYKLEEKKEGEKEDALNQLKKYKEQLDLEIITQEEYNQHKESLGKIIKG
jgi:Skp family chaperone for outer membrane proteins